MICHINCKLHWECFSTCIKSFILLLWRKKNANEIQTYSGKENASTIQKIKNLTTNGMYHKNVYILKHKRRGEYEIFRRKVTNSTNFNDNLIKLVSSQLHVY